MPESRHHIPPRLTAHARMNRRLLTLPETRLWRHLRDRQLAGLKFRRQQVIGPYIADFCCFDARLIVELDGDSHVGQAAYDERRTAWLRSQGLTVLRFNNSDVFGDIGAVLDAIALTCDAQRPSPPTPLPRRGEGSPR